MTEEEKDQTTQQEKQIAEIEQLKKDYITVFTGEAGKRVLKHLENTCYIHRSTLPGKNNPIRLAFNEGQRSIVIHIKNMLIFRVESLIKLNREGEKDV